MHLRKIAHAHTETLFLKLDVEKAPFVVGKLQVVTIPTVVCFVDGIAIDRLTGFDELGGDDEFETVVLSRRLCNSDALKAKNKAEAGRIAIKTRKAREYDSSDED